MHMRVPSSACARRVRARVPMRTARGAGDVGRSGKCDRCPGFLGPRRVTMVGSVTTMEPKLLVVGGGRMGGALVHGLLGAGWSPTDIVVVEPSADVGAGARSASSRASRCAPTSPPSTRRRRRRQAGRGRRGVPGPGRRRGGPGPVDHGRRAPGPTRIVAPAHHRGGAGHAQHAGHGRSRDLRHGGGVEGDRARPGLGRGAARAPSATSSGSPRRRSTP